MNIRRATGPTCALIFAVLLSCASVLRAQDTTRSQGVRIGLTYAPGTRPGVLILPMNGVNADSVRAILARDLDFGDRVNVIAPDGGDVSAGALNYPLYAQLGAAAILQGAMTPAGGLHVAVHDVAGARVMNAQDFALPSPALGPEWRLAIHGAADEIERWITGVRGIAQTRLIHVRDQRLWIVDSDGANAFPVPGIGPAVSPAWHPGGRSIAYCTLDADGTHISVRDLITGTSRRVSTRGGSNITPTFSPDGNTLVFAAGEDGLDLFSASPLGKDQPSRLTAGRGSSTSNPTFSPDGRHIAFTSGRLGHPEVYITDADGTNADLLTTTAFGDQLYRSNPDWSPDGRRVAFQSQINGVFQIMAINLRDKSVVALTSEGRNEDPSWAPDGRHIAFTSTRSGPKQIWVLDTDSGRLRQLTHGSAARQGAWSPHLGGAR